MKIFVRLLYLVLGFFIGLVFSLAEFEKYLAERHEWKSYVTTFILQDPHHPWKYIATPVTIRFCWVTECYKPFGTKEWLSPVEIRKLSPQDDD